jgi:hypothetical protein
MRERACARSVAAVVGLGTTAALASATATAAESAAALATATAEAALAHSLLHLLHGFLELASVNLAIVVGIGSAEHAHHLRRNFFRGERAVAVAIPLGHHAVGAAAETAALAAEAATAAPESTGAASAATAAAKLARGRRQLFFRKLAVAVGVSALEHLGHEARELVFRELAVAVLVVLHPLLDHLSGVAAAASATTADAGFLGGDVAVFIDVERLERGDRLTEFGRADGLIAVGVEGREEDVLAAAASSASAETTALAAEAATSALTTEAAATLAAAPAASTGSAGTAIGVLAEFTAGIGSIAAAGSPSAASTPSAGFALIAGVLGRDGDRREQAKSHGH